MDTILLNMLTVLVTRRCVYVSSILGGAFDILSGRLFMVAVGVIYTISEEWLMGRL